VPEIHAALYAPWLEWLGGTPSRGRSGSGVDYLTPPFFRTSGVRSGLRQ
jgi:hypothetical protein